MGQEKLQEENPTLVGDIYAPFTPPFSYSPFGQMIQDTNGERMLDIRGWGYLTGKGCAALGLSNDLAEKIQDRIGEQIAKVLNDSILVTE